MSRPIAQPARAREAVARYLPADDETRFTRGLEVYARCQDGCLDRAAGDPECRDLCRRAGAATLWVGVPHLAADFLDRGDKAIPRQPGVPDAIVTWRAAAVEQPLEGRLRLDEGAPHSPQGAQADLLSQRPVGMGVDVGHAQDLGDVPVRGQPRADAEASESRSLLVHDDARIRCGGVLPAVWSAYS